MNEEELNMQIRRFLKKVGIQSQREIEQTMRGGAESGAVKPGDTLPATMNLRIDALGLDVNIDGEIKI